MPEKLKLLFLAPHLSTGGMPSFLLKRIESLITNENLEIFVVEFKNFSSTYVVQKNRIKELIKPENFFTLEDDKSVLMKIIKDNNIDIIHADEIMEGFESFNQVPITLLNQLYSNDRTWRIVETCHNVWFDPNTMKKFYPDAYAFCTPWHKEVTFSKMDSYSEVIEFPLENKVPTKNQKFESKKLLGFDTNKKHVINVGLWTSGKNQKEGVEIAKLLEFSNPDIHFHFIGNQAINFQEYWGPIMQNIPSNVTVWGERSDVDIFMTAADLFMFNSTWECNPLVLREAISHGLKIVSRNLPQYMNMFSGYITPIDSNLQTNSEKIVNLLQDEQETFSVNDELESYKTRYYEFYKKVKNQEIKKQQIYIEKPKITQSFINNPFLEIRASEGYNSNFKVEFYDENGKCHYSNTIKANHWVKLNREYFTKWTAKVWEEGSLIYENTLNFENKRVFISFESRSLGDTLSWVPYLEDFQKKHNCYLTVSTFWNNLFRESYPEIEFVEPGSTVHNIYAMYRIGWYYKEDSTINTQKNPRNFRTLPLQQTITDILGLDYYEKRPKMNLPTVEKKKKVGIAIHSTAQAKYWNNSNGWQEVVNYLNTKGYEVVLYSRENDGYMGNKQPQGITKFTGDGKIESVIKDMLSCQFFIGLGSGLSWLSWSIGLPTVLISGFSEEYSETKIDTYRVINKSVCHGCFNFGRLDAGDWKWCPIYKNSERQFECTKEITSKMVIEKIEELIYDKGL